MSSSLSMDDALAKYFPESCLRNLKLSCTNDPIVVGVVDKFDETFSHYEDQRLLILADESGARIGATVPNNLLKRFAFMRKDHWYTISKFRVEVRPHYLKWTEHNFQIVLDEDSTSEPAPKKKDDPFEFFVKIPKLLDGSAYENFNVVNVLGGIVKVDRMEDEELVFWIKDFE